MSSLNLLIILTLCNCSVLSFPMNNTHCHDKKMRHNLHVSTLQNEPFVKRNNYGDLSQGIEFELIKIIVEKENLKLLTKNQLQ